MRVNSNNKNRMTHPRRVAKNCTTHPLSRVQKLMTHPLSASAHPPPPPILFDQSLTPVVLSITFFSISSFFSIVGFLQPTYARFFRCPHLNYIILTFIWITSLRLFSIQLQFISMCSDPFARDSKLNIFQLCSF